jgi:alkaline phosphatase
VLFGGGAEQFKPGSGSPNKTNYYDAFAAQGYQVVNDNTALQAADASKRTLGIFSTSNMAKWLDRHVYTDNLKNGTVSPLVNNTGPTYDQPGLAQMTLKAIDILKARDTENKGFFMMSEAASIDKMFHVLDYERALGELLELDDTVRQTIEHLEKIGELDETLIIVTADHGHGFDVFGSSDTKYMKVATTDRLKRESIGTYQNSGHSEYQVAPGSRPENQTVVTGPQGPNFPVQWDPRYALAAGFAAHPDVRETYSVDTRGPRVPATNSTPARNE